MLACRHRRALRSPHWADACRHQGAEEPVSVLPDLLPTLHDERRRGRLKGVAGWRTPPAPLAARRVLGRVPAARSCRGRNLQAAPWHTYGIFGWRRA